MLAYTANGILHTYRESLLIKYTTYNPVFSPNLHPAWQQSLQILKSLTNQPTNKSRFFCIKFGITWDGGEEFDSIPMTVETELSVSHGAVGHEGPGRHFVAAVITVDTNYTSWMVSCS